MFKLIKKFFIGFKKTYDMSFVDAFINALIKRSLVYHYNFRTSENSMYNDLYIRTVNDDFLVDKIIKVIEKHGYNLSINTDEQYNGFYRYLVFKGKF